MYLNADSAKIETDEDGFRLVVMCDDGDPITFNIHGCAEELYDSVKANIGPWLRERDETHSEFRTAVKTAAMFACDPDQSGGYAVGDPKHSDYHSIHVDLSDAR